MQKMGKIEIVKKYFAPPKVTMKELRELGMDAIGELAQDAAKELGVEVA